MSVLKLIERKGSLVSVIASHVNVDHVIKQLEADDVSAIVVSYDNQQIGKDLKAEQGEEPKLARKLTAVELFALAFASSTNRPLPEGLQEWSNPYDIQSMLLGRSCGRDGYILGQAVLMLESFTGRTLENLTARVSPPAKHTRQDLIDVLPMCFQERKIERVFLDWYMQIADL